MLTPLPSGALLFISRNLGPLWGPVDVGNESITRTSPSGEGSRCIPTLPKTDTFLPDSTLHADRPFLGPIFQFTPGLIQSLFRDLKHFDRNKFHLSIEQAQVLRIHSGQCGTLRFIGVFMSATHALHRWKRSELVGLAGQSK